MLIFGILLSKGPLIQDFVFLCVHKLELFFFIEFFFVSTDFCSIIILLNFSISLI